MRSLNKNEKEPVKVNTAIRTLQTNLTEAETDIAGKQPLDADLTAIAALTTDAAGRSVLTLADPGADRIIFWDDSESTAAYLTPGTGLAITTTSLDVSTVPVANGGTGQTTAAEAIGELIQACDSLTAVDRQLDTVGVYDSDADTGKETPLYALAGCAVLASGTVSAAAALDLALAGYTQFRTFQLQLSGIFPSTDGSGLFLRISDDSGSTFEADASDYQWGRSDVGLATTPSPAGTGDGTDSEIELLPAIGNAANELSSLVITIHDPAAAQFTHVEWTGTFTNTSGSRFAVRGSGVSLAAAAVTDIRVLASADNLTCKYTLVGFI